jgi:pilus assembly protein CpaE
MNEAKMSSSTQQAEDTPIVACTISRDVQVFDLLIEDMETALGDAWGDLGFSDALPFFQQPDADLLDFVALAVDAEDEADIEDLVEIIKGAKEKGIKVILVAEDVSPVSLHRLLRAGADEFVPYPLPENELAAAIEKVNAPEPVQQSPRAVDNVTRLKPSSGRNGIVLPVHGLAGGTGASTLAVNLAWELTQIEKGANAPRVCLLDLDLQFGSVATYLDLPRRDAVYEMLSDTEAMDSESFLQALISYEDVLHVLTAPPDILPLDFLLPEDVSRIIAVARENFDFVIIDMPSTLVQWTETALSASQIYLATFEMDMRSVQNALRMKRALQAEDLPFDKMRFALNRAPKFTDLSGKARVKRIGETLGITIELQLPDGGKQVMQGADRGTPLSESGPKTPLRKEIQKLAASLHAFNAEELVAENG